MAATWPDGKLSAPLSRWFDRLLMARDRLLTSESFRTRAAALPVARTIARRRARELFDVCAGFVYSQTLLACVQLQLFERLAQAPRSASELAGVLALPDDACARLLQAAEALRLVEKRGGERYGLGPLGAALVDNPSLVTMIEHHRHLYEDLRDPLALLRGSGEGETRLSTYWPYADANDPAGLGDTQVAEYSRLMSLSQPLVADEVLDVYALDQHRHLMDVGGGEGAFIACAARRSPRLLFTLFDLPAVCRRADVALAKVGLTHRVATQGGDFFRDPLPRGADAISLVRVLLDHDEARVVGLLRACRAALPSDGTLLVAEPLAAPERDRIGAAYFGMYLLAMGRGRARSEAELRLLLGAAGFGSVEVRVGRRVLGTAVIVARP